MAIGDSDPIPRDHFSGGANLAQDGGTDDDLASVLNVMRAATIAAAAAGGGVQPEISMAVDLTPTAAQSGTLFRANPAGGEISLTLGALPQGTWFELYKVAAGTVLWALTDGATARQSDPQIENTYERIRFQMGPGGEWNIEGTLSAAPSALPAGGVQYLRLEDITTEGTLVTSMNDVIASANAVQAAELRPSLGSGNGPNGADSIVFGGTQYFPRSVLAAPVAQEHFISAVIYIPSGSNSGALWDDTPAAAFQRCFLNFQNIRGFNGGGGSWANESHAFDTWFVVTVHGNGASTAVKIGAGGWSTKTDGGSNAINGLSLGADSDASDVATFRMTDRVIGSGNQAAADAWHTHLRTLRGL